MTMNLCDLYQVNRILASMIFLAIKNQSILQGNRKVLSSSLMIVLSPIIVDFSEAPGFKYLKLAVLTKNLE